MMLFLILLPFAVFTSLMLVASSPISLFAAAAVASTIVLYDVISGRSLKILPVGSSVVFAAIGLYTTLVDPHVSPMAIRIAVDSGILAITLGSLIIGLPFTIQYAREVVDAETAALPGFLRVNNILTLAWAGAAILMLLSNLLITYWPSLSLWFGIGIAFAARNSAAYFTHWYPQHHRAKMKRAATPI